LWEKLNNPDFKPIEFERFRNEAGNNYFVLSPQRWIESTNAIGIVSKSGRYGGTFAHKDIAIGYFVEYGRYQCDPDWAGIVAKHTSAAAKRNCDNANDIFDE